MYVHSDYRGKFLKTLAILAFLGLLQLLFWFRPPVLPTDKITSFTAIHTMMEMVSIVISIMVFTVSWGAYDKSRPVNFMILGCTFLGVGILDFNHLLSYPGMPEFVSPSSPEKSIYFWLSARLMVAIGVMTVVFVAWRPIGDSRYRWLLLGLVLLLVGTISWIGLLHLDWLPDTFIPGQGLTAFKVWLELMLIGLYSISAIRLLLMMRSPQAFDVLELFAAMSVMAMGEIYFTHYVHTADIYNLLGHLYKVIAYAIIYHSIFLGSIKRPYLQLDESRGLLQSIIESIPVRVFWKDRNLRYLGCNRVFAQDAGEPDPQALLGKLDSDLGWREHAALYQADDRKVMESGVAKLAYEEPLTTGDGGNTFLRTSKVPLRDKDEKIIGVLGIYEDISAEKHAEESMRLAAMVYENSSEAMVVTDAHGRVISVNPAFSKITGYSADEMLGKNISLISSLSHNNEASLAMHQAVEAQGYWQGEIVSQRKDGEIFYQWLTVNTIFHADGSPHRRISLFSDITEKKKSEELIWQQANFDILTNLPNRRMFHDRLEQEIKKANRSSTMLALMLLDIDRFKEVNDVYGHDKGDELLVEAARRIVECVRDTDIVARLGGDEFTLTLGSIEDIGSVERVAKNILKNLSEPFQLNGHSAYVTASIGIAIYPNDVQTADALIKGADQAMYAAKNQGRNRYQYFTPAMQKAADIRLEIANDLRVALAAQHFRLVYQPIVEMANGRIHKAEALIRWEHPQKGTISPASFIPIAEDTGLIVDIGDWVFYQAARQVRQWRQTLSPEFQISINKSPVQFRDERDVQQTWLQYLQQAGLPGQSIVVEITEGMLMDASEKINTVLIRYRDAGVEVALDDFGTGYSSLAYLNRFDIDYIKIDQSFVRNLAPGSSDLAMCSAIIVMAHKLDMLVIAEGVETPEQRNLLLAAGCDYAQGYYFSRPVDADHFERMMRTQGLVQMPDA